MTADDPDRPVRHHAGPEPSSVPGPWAPWGLDRRNTLAVVGSVLVGSLAGCLSGPSFPDADVVAGADGNDAFEPAELTVAVGDTVTWGFASAGHNVCCRPGDDGVRLPAEADGFASYGPDEPPDGSFVPRGGTYEHAFDVAGRYHYVCVPHDDLGMTGTVHVE